MFLCISKFQNRGFPKSNLRGAGNADGVCASGVEVCDSRVAKMLDETKRVLGTIDLGLKMAWITKGSTATFDSKAGDFLYSCGTKGAME